jgi:xanthine dehydrogenase large subunit
MLEQSEIFELNTKYLFGRVINSTVAKAHIAAIEIPSDRRFPDITVVYATDLGSCNYVDVMGTKVPILASEEVSYQGQPVMAVFGPEDEDVELFCKEVKISYKIEPEADANATEVYEEPFSWSYGDTSEFFVQGAKTVKSTFSVAAHESTLLGGQRVFAALENGVMNLQLETQWPVNVRKSVANALGYPLDKVCVNAQPNEASYDQFIFSPTVLACLAAVAAEKTNSPVQICAPLVSY